MELYFKNYNIDCNLFLIFKPVTKILLKWIILNLDNFEYLMRVQHFFFKNTETA